LGNCRQIIFIRAGDQRPAARRRPNQRTGLVLMNAFKFIAGDFT